MKKIVILLSVFFLAISMAQAKGKKKIAVLFPGSVEFFSVQKKGMDKAAKERKLELIYSDAEWDPGKQLSQVENFVARGVDLILLCPADGQALISAVEIVNEANIPLITFTNALGSDPEGKLPGVISFIGTNEVKVGELLGKMAEQLLGKKKANIVLIEGTPGTSPQRMRTKGFKNIISRHKNWKIVYQQGIHGWTKEGALAAMEAFLQRGQKVDLVATHWHAGASAASTALQEAKYKKDVHVIGLEFSKELIPEIKSGKVDMTSNYSILGAGYQAVIAASDYLKGKKIKKFIEIKPEIISKKNINVVKAEL